MIVFFFKPQYAGQLSIICSWFEYYLLLHLVEMLNWECPRYFCRLWGSRTIRAFHFSALTTQIFCLLRGGSKNVKSWARFLDWINLLKILCVVVCFSCLCRARQISGDKLWLWVHIQCAWGVRCSVLAKQPNSPLVYRQERGVWAGNLDITIKSNFDVFSGGKI